MKGEWCCAVAGKSWGSTCRRTAILIKRYPVSKNMQCSSSKQPPSAKEATDSQVPLVTSFRKEQIELISTTDTQRFYSEVVF